MYIAWLAPHSHTRTYQPIHWWALSLKCLWHVHRCDGKEVNQNAGGCDAEAVVQKLSFNSSGIHIIIPTPRAVALYGLVNVFLNTYDSSHQPAIKSLVSSINCVGARRVKEQCKKHLIGLELKIQTYRIYCSLLIPAYLQALLNIVLEGLC